VLGNAVASDAGTAAEPAGTAASGGQGQGPAIDTGVGKYSLLAVISHIGKGTDHGHYVSHILKDGAWVLYNDEKVSNSTPTCACVRA
jgi:ubiquitin carboxyl-terminal hydrolase 5/13